MTDLEWEYARCPICGLDYPYVKGSYKPKTCGNFDCVHKFLHPEIRKEASNGQYQDTYRETRQR